MLHVGHFDAAVAGRHMAEAVNDHTQHEALTAFLGEGVIRHGPCVRPISFGDPLVQDACQWADVIFFHVSLKDASTREMPKDDLWDDPGLSPYLGKAVMWLNGSTALRHNFEGYSRRMEGFRRVATNADVAEQYGAVWMPCAIAAPLDSGMLRWSCPEMGALLTVSHCPTDIAIKNVLDMKRAVDARMMRWIYKCISGRPHWESLAERMAAHVTFDHLQGYFGVCAIEAAALGMPLIVRLDESSQRALSGFGGLPPWLLVDDVSLVGQMLDDVERMDLPALGRANRAWYEAGFTNRHKANRLCQWLEAA